MSTVRPVGQPGDHVGEHNGNVARCAHRGNAGVGAEPAHDHHVGHVVKGLQQHGGKVGQGKKQQLFRHAAFGEIGLKRGVLFSHEKRPLISGKSRGPRLKKI